ncbi:MAG TPA: NUDIX domain-containing protein [Desulfosporosinus sp.]
MIHHNIYNSWSWIGGHADGEEDLSAVVMKELKEETEVNNIHPVSSDSFSFFLKMKHKRRVKGEAS